jgi:hypothetical protein
VKPGDCQEAVPDLRDLNAADEEKMRDLLRKAFTPADLDTLNSKPGGPPAPERVQLLARLRALQDPQADMAKASGDARMVFNSCNQAWLDWANALPTPADRAAAWSGAEKKGDTGTWGEGIREKAKQQLTGEGL